MGSTRHHTLCHRIGGGADACCSACYLCLGGEKNKTHIANMKNNNPYKNTYKICEEVS